jgi:hypothetical protein
MSAHAGATAEQRKPYAVTALVVLCVPRVS